MRGGLALTFAAALGGCAVGPNYRRPAVTVPAAFRGAALATQAASPAGSTAQPASLADLPWWEMFQDEHLLTLIREALGNNYGLAAAAERVEQARALAGLGTTALLPAVGVQAGPSYQQTFLPVQIADAASPRYPLYQLQATLSWELDLWGRLRRLREAALGDYLASEEARRGVMVTLVGDVAQGYFQLLALDLQLAIAHRTVESRRETLRLFEELARGGVGNRLQTASADANLASARGTIPDLERQIALRENQLALLLGRSPQPIARHPDLLRLPAPPSLPPGQPAALLERRPDLRQAEAGLLTANAQVGAAFAEFFPRLSLTGSAGLTSTSLPALFTAGAATFGIGLLTSWLVPLLNGYQIRYRHRAQQANWRALVASYRQAVLSALVEVSSALIAIDRLHEQRSLLETEVRARSESVELAKIRFRNGVASYLEVVQAEQNLFPAELQLAQLIGSQFVYTTQLYRALGGGWQPPPRVAADKPDAR